MPIMYVAKFRLEFLSNVPITKFRELVMDYILFNH